MDRKSKEFVSLCLSIILFTVFLISGVIMLKVNGKYPFNQEPETVILAEGEGAGDSKEKEEAQDTSGNLSGDHSNGQQTGPENQTDNASDDPNAEQISGSESGGGQESHLDESGNDGEKTYEFTTAPEGYFNDALFIGDSRTVGLKEYSGLEGASFFATSGMSVYNYAEETAEISGVGKVTLEELIEKKQYGKIYVMLGINELGYDRQKTADRYKRLLDKIHEKQPEAIIYIQANLHVSASRSSSDKIYNNKNINLYNEKLSAFADNKDFFYIDINEVFDDANGNLDAQYTSDNAHILGKYYQVWGDWFRTKAIVK